MKIKYIFFRMKKMIYDMMKQVKLIKKRPLFDNCDGISFYKEKITSASEGNQSIAELLNDSNPCMIARIGTTEMGVLNNCLAKKYNMIKHISRETIKNLCDYSGFFPASEEKIEQWADLYLRCLPQMDLCAVFDNHTEDYVIHEFAKKTRMTQLCALEPYYFEQPWSWKALRGKKVLVIHPFAKTIEMQYEKHHVLFEGKILPDFEIRTIEAVQSLAGQHTKFNDWFEALDFMQEQMKASDFDIAIIGCGAYGLPLAAYAKEMGKKAIVTAGPTQLLFGIKGARWDNNPMINRYFDDNWVRPLESERPEHADIVEQGCYW